MGLTSDVLDNDVAARDRFRYLSYSVAEKEPEEWVSEVDAEGIVALGWGTVGG